MPFDSVTQFASQDPFSRPSLPGMREVLTDPNVKTTLLSLLIGPQCQYPQLYEGSPEQIIEFIQEAQYSKAFRLVFVCLALAGFIGEPKFAKKPPLPHRYPTWKAFWVEFARQFGVKAKTLKTWHKAGLAFSHLLGYRGIPSDTLLDSKGLPTLFRKLCVLDTPRMLATSNADLVQHLVNDSVEDFACFAGKVKQQRARPKDAYEEAPQDSPKTPPVQNLAVYVEAPREYVEAFEQLAEDYEYQYLVPLFHDGDVNTIQDNLEQRRVGCEAQDEQDFGLPHPEKVDFVHLPKTLGALRDTIDQYRKEEVLGDLKISVATYRLSLAENDYWWKESRSFKEWCEANLGINKGSVSYHVTVGRTYLAHSEQILQRWKTSQAFISKIRHLEAALANHQDQSDFVWSYFTRLTDRQFAQYAKLKPEAWQAYEQEMRRVKRAKAARRVLDCLEQLPKAPAYIPIGFDYEMDVETLRFLCLPHPGTPRREVPKVILLPASHQLSA